MHQPPAYPPAPQTTSGWTPGRKRALLIAAIAVGVAMLLCAGLVAMVFTSDSDTDDASARPAAAITSARTYATLTDRDWLLLVKNPDQFAGKGFLVYGVVTQADGATGDNAFLAHAGATQLNDPFGYSTNTIFFGQTALLAKLVEGDQFQAKVTVKDAYTYDTQNGGSTTAPRLQVDAIAITTPAPGDRPAD